MNNFFLMNNIRARKKRPGCIINRFLFPASIVVLIMTILGPVQIVTGQGRFKSECSCAENTCIGSVCVDHLSGKKCPGTLAPDCTPYMNGISPNRCGFCCNETCEHFGYKCGKFSKCGVPGALVCGDEDGDGEPDCDCTDTCYPGNKRAGVPPQTTCVGSKIYTCGQDEDDKDDCYEFVDDPGTYMECPGGCVMKDKFNAKCSCENDCQEKGTYCSSNKFGSFIDICTEGDYGDGCLKKVDNYFKCEGKCVEPKPGAAFCECVDECSMGDKKCEVFTETVKIDNEWETFNSYYKYSCGEAHDFDDCNDWTDKRECAYGCNADLTDCVTCRDECREGDIKCVPYDSDGDGIPESKAVYSCGFKDNKDRCLDWLPPEQCLGEYYCKEDQKDAGCFCIDCTLGENKCVEYPVSKWTQVDSVWGWHFELEPRKATCIYDYKLGCNIWADPEFCESGNAYQNNSCTVGSYGCCSSNCGIDGFSQESSVRCVEGIAPYKKVGYRSICQKNEEQCLNWEDYGTCLDGCEKIKTDFGYFNTGNCNPKTCVDECSPGHGAEIICRDGMLKRCVSEAMDGDSCADLVEIEKCEFGCLGNESNCAPSKCKCSSLGQTKCIDNKIFKCTDNDNDGCFEWTDPQECQHGCKAQDKGSKDSCASSCADIEECRKPGKVCKEINGVYSLYTCAEANDGDDCLDVIINENQEFCKYGCTLFDNECRSECDNSCKKEGQLICKDVPWIFGSRKSDMFACEKADPDNICFDLAERSECEYGCNFNNTACLSEPDKCLNPKEERCINNYLYVCRKQADGRLDWELKKPGCPYGCLPDTGKCASCVNEEGCYEEGQFVCMSDKRYKCEDVNGDGCLERTLVESCEYGCPTPNPYFSSECVPCLFNCENPGPPFDDDDPYNRPEISFSCGKFAICGKKDKEGDPAFDCGPCPGNCRSVPIEENHVRYNYSVCEYMWGGKVIYKTKNVIGCYDLKAEQDIEGYKYSKGILQKNTKRDGFTYYEICREPGN